MPMQVTVPDSELAPKPTTSAERVVEFDHYRDLQTGRYIARDFAESLPPHWVVKERRRIILVNKPVSGRALEA